MRATKTSDANPYNFKKLLPLAVIGLVAVAAFIGLKDYLSFNALRENRAWLIEWRDQNYVLAALSYIGVYVAAVAFSVPGALVITLAGGFLFGLFAGTFFTVIGATIGATTIFLAAKYGLGDRLFEKLKGDGSKGMISKLEAGLREDEVSYLFLMRLVPAFPFFVANLAPAFLGVKLRNFVFTTFLGIIPGTAVYTWVGSGLGEVFARGETPNLGIIFQPIVLGPILGLCALSILPIALKKLRKGDAK